MTKGEIAELFEEIAALLELKNDNPFRVRASECSANYRRTH